MFSADAFGTGKAGGQSTLLTDAHNVTGSKSVLPRVANAPKVREDTRWHCVQYPILPIAQ